VVPEEPWHLRYVCGDDVPTAVKDYMSKNGITAPDPTANKKPDAPAPVVQKEDDGGLKLKLGDKGDKVKQMQEALNKKGFACTADGNFGPATEKALNYFKKSVSLQTNGVCNQRTWDALTA
jgi:peptidoglycan hydrolase-like protein with peptidoglycan-binding domain